MLRKTTTTPIAEPSTTTQSRWSYGEIIFAIYILGVLIFLAVFLVQILVLLTRKYNLNSIKTGRYTIVELIKEEEPYSFMNTIFINPSIYTPETYEQIIEHEKLHIDQRHFIDKFLAEITLIIFWFNPFAWMLRSAIGKNLEFLTDQTLLRNGMEKESYQLSLLKVSVSTRPFNMVNSYNNSFLKNRILMMNSKNSSIASTWKYLFILPLFFLSLISLNAVTQNEILSANQQIESTSVEVEKELEQSIEKPAKKSSKENHLESAKRKNKNKSGTSNKNITKNKNKSKGNFKAQSEALKAIESNGAGEYSSKKLDLDPFSKVVLSIPGNLIMRQSNEQTVKIEGPAELIDLINTEIYDDEWNIKFPNKSFNDYGQSINVVVSLPNLSAVGVNGIGKISSDGKFELNNDINFACSGVGQINFEANAMNFLCAISGSGNINVKGEGLSSRLVISGSGKIFAEELKVKEAEITISGSGDTFVDAAENINVVISGSGTVFYRGDPKIKSKYSGAGRAIKRN